MRRLIWCVCPPPPSTCNTLASAVSVRRSPSDLIDRDEVTNRDFKAFVDAGGLRHTRVLDGAICRRRSDGVVGKRHAPVRRSDRPARPRRHGMAAPTRTAKRMVLWRVSAGTKRAGTRPSRAAASPRSITGFARRTPMTAAFSWRSAIFQGKAPRPSGVRMRLVPSVQSIWPATFASGAGTRAALSASARRLLGGSGLYVDQGQLAPPLDRSITNGFRCAKYSSGPLLTNPIIQFRRPRISVLRPRAMTRSRSTEACTGTNRPM